MTELEVLNLILNQLGGLRIPMREEELIQQVGVIIGNARALRDAVANRTEKAEKEAEEPDSGREEPEPAPEDKCSHAGCACSSAKEAANDVQR